jgi:hypothetical protein
MKAKDVPQDRENSYYAGYQRACYAVDENGRYTVVRSEGWEAENIVNASANAEVRENIAAALRRARAGEVSPLAVHMARTQMTKGLLAAYSGVSRWKIWWHLKPKAFARMSARDAERYARAMQISVAELLSLPEENCDRL